MLPGRGFRTSFNRLFRDIESEIETVEDEIDDLIQRARKAGPRQEGEPLIYGWSLQVGPEGEPRFERFGNVGTSEQEMVELAEGWRRPHTTWHVDEDANELTFTAELPGVSKNEIDLEILEPDCIQLEAQSGDRKYKTVCRVGHDLDPQKTKARFNKGVLEATIGLAKPPEPPTTKINVE